MPKVIPKPGELWIYHRRIETKPVLVLEVIRPFSIAFLTADGTTSRRIYRWFLEDYKLLKASTTNDQA